MRRWRPFLGYGKQRHPRKDDPCWRPLSEALRTFGRHASGLLTLVGRRGTFTLLTSPSATPLIAEPGKGLDPSGGRGFRLGNENNSY